MADLTPQALRGLSLLALLPALTLGGCGLTGIGSAPAGNEADIPPATTGTKRTLTPQSSPPLERLPLPVGFKMDPRESHRYHTDRGRVLLHVYKGNATRDEVEAFYRHVMPLNGWRYQGSQMVRGAVQLRFEKDKEWADLTIRERWTLIGGEGSRIEAQVQTLAPPKSRP